MIYLILMNRGQFRQYFQIFDDDHNSPDHVPLDDPGVGTCSTLRNLGANYVSTQVIPGVTTCVTYECNRPLYM